MEALSRGVQIAIPFCWAGLLAGISFLEAPLKFRAPGITLGLALGLGRLVFAALNRIEVVLCLALIVSFVVSGVRGGALWLLVGVTLLLAAQTLLLLPKLEARALQLIAGQTPAATAHHVVYIIFDTIKLVLLAASGVVAIKRYTN